MSYSLLSPKDRDVKKGIFMKKTNSVNRRVNKSRTLKFETLETRELLAADLAQGGMLTAVTRSDALPTANWYDLSSSSLSPSGAEQELLEQINRFRTDPQGEIDRIFSVATSDSLVARNKLVNSAISLTDYPSGSIDTFLEEMRSISVSSPLAFNAALEKAAFSHSSSMKNRNDVSHLCSGEEPLAKRVAKAGFVNGSNDNGIISLSENIGGSFVESEGWSVASYIEAAFVVDWGVSSHTHRDSMVNAAYSEIGISIQQTGKSIGPYIVTCDFGTSVEGASVDGAYLLGVIYDDIDSDRFYDVGEGLSNVSVTIECLTGDNTGETVTVSSWTSGGYQLFLKNGSYKVTVEGNGMVNPITKTVSISNGINTKLDFLASEAGTIPPTLDLDVESEGNDVSVIFVEGSQEPYKVFTANNIKIVDPDSVTLTEAKISFEVRPDGEREMLDVMVADTDLKATFDAQTGEISITGTASVKDYEKVLSSLSYFNESELCDLTSRTVNISVYDGSNWSSEAVLTIEVQPTVLPNMTVQEMTAYEGDTGSKLVRFVVELDSPARLDVSFNFEVALGGTAIEGENFVVSVGDPITIAAGEKFGQIDCYVIGNYTPIKPEGLALVDGQYENPELNFFLSIVDVENAYLTNEDSLVKGTIFDDDSPIVLGVTDKYAFSNLPTDMGQRRYVFSLTSESSGIFTWDANALGLPESTKITVREACLESEPIVVSNPTKTGGNVQWFTDPSCEYWITVESEADLSTIVAKLLTITEDQLVLVDPLFDDSDNNLLTLMWEDDALVVGAGDVSWNLGNNYWKGLNFNSNRGDIECALEVSPFNSSSVISEDDSTSFWFGNEKAIATTGFSIYRFSGSDENETLKLMGTSGKDNLFYSNGSGSLLRSDGIMYMFNGINNVVIEGNGGNDSAVIEDSYWDDRFETSNDSLAMMGGGYALTAKYFSNVQVFFNKGGEDSYYATDSGDNVSAVISNNSSIFSGTYTFEDISQDVASAVDEENINTDPTSMPVSYVRIVSGVEQLILEPKESIGSVVLYGDNSSSSFFNAEVGSLVSYNTRNETTTTVSRVKSLVISNLNKDVDERFNVSLPSSYSSYVDGNNLVVIDKNTNWSLSIPNWKNVGDTPSSALFEAYVPEFNFDTSSGNRSTVIPQVKEQVEILDTSVAVDSSYIDLLFSDWSNVKNDISSQFIDYQFLDVFTVAHSLNEHDKNKKLF